jgi:hypothetical protein
VVKGIAIVENKSMYKMTVRNVTEYRFDNDKKKCKNHGYNIDYDGASGIFPHEHNFSDEF